MKYISTKRFDDLGPTVYRQWRADSHCKFLHGYCLSFYLEFEADTLDDKNWVVDFGGLKDIKKVLESWFDHTVVVALDDPEKEALFELEKLNLAKIRFFSHIGAEYFAEVVYKYVNETFLPEYEQGKRVWCRKVQVFENGKNSAIVEGHRPGPSYTNTGL